MFCKPFFLSFFLSNFFLSCSLIHSPAYFFLSLYRLLTFSLLFFAYSFLVIIFTGWQSSKLHGVLKIEVFSQKLLSSYLFIQTCQRSNSFGLTSHLSTHPTRQAIFYKARFPVSINTTRHCPNLSVASVEFYPIQPSHPKRPTQEQAETRPTICRQNPSSRDFGFRLFHSPSHLATCYNLSGKPNRQL